MAGRPELLTEELKDHVGRLFNSNRKLTARKAQTKILEYLAGGLKQRQPKSSKEELFEQIKEDGSLPGVSVIGKHLTDLRKRYKSNSKLDTPWSIGASIEHDITADVIPILVKYRQILLDTTQKGGDISSRLTIRKARWMSRLYPVVKNLLSNQFPDEKIQIGYLSRIADEYAEREKAANNSDRPFSNTYILDALVFVRDNSGLTIDEALILASVAEMTTDEFKSFYKAMEIFKKDGAK